MSALDLFASAMGAFLLIAVMALPYYLKTDKSLVQDIQKLKKKIETISNKLSKCQSKNSELQEQNRQITQQNKKMQKELTKTFCVIKLSWESSSKEDVDLHVTDPEGREFSYKKRSYSGSSASLTVDSKGVKKGAEVWIDKELHPGTYLIEYVYYSGSGSISINGMVLTKSFTEDLPRKHMRNPNSNQRVKIAKILVDANGNASLETF